MTSSVGQIVTEICNSYFMLFLSTTPYVLTTGYEGRNSIILGHLRGNDSIDEHDFLQY